MEMYNETVNPTFLAGSYIKGVQIEWSTVNSIRWRSFTVMNSDLASHESFILFFFYVLTFKTSGKWATVRLFALILLYNISERVGCLFCPTSMYTRCTHHITMQLWKPDLLIRRQQVLLKFCELVTLQSFNRPWTIIFQKENDVTCCKK